MTIQTKTPVKTGVVHRTDPAVERELELLREENARMKAKLTRAASPVRFKLTDKGMISIYGLGQRFPVTLNKVGINKLIEAWPDFVQFVEDNRDSLADKEF